MRRRFQYIDIFLPLSFMLNNKPSPQFSKADLWSYSLGSSVRPFLPVIDPSHLRPTLQAFFTLVFLLWLCFVVQSAYGRGKLFQEGSIISNLSYFKPKVNETLIETRFRRFCFSINYYWLWILLYVSMCAICMYVQ